MSVIYRCDICKSESVIRTHITTFEVRSGRCSTADDTTTYMRPDVCPTCRAGLVRGIKRIIAGMKALKT